MFHVGQKVVCVETYRPLDYPYQVASVGAVYTVARLYEEDGELMLEVAEILQPEDETWLPGQRASDYRPVVERKTDISIFTEMLTPKTEQVPA